MKFEKESNVNGELVVLGLEKYLMAYYTYVNGAPPNSKSFNKEYDKFAFRLRIRVGSVSVNS